MGWEGGVLQVKRCKGKYEAKLVSQRVGRRALGENPLCREGGGGYGYPILKFNGVEVFVIAFSYLYSVYMQDLFFFP